MQSVGGGVGRDGANGSAIVIDLAAERLSRLVAQNPSGEFGGPSLAPHRDPVRDLIPDQTGSDAAWPQTSPVPERRFDGQLTIRSFAPDGFDISLFCVGDKVVAWFGGLECEFESLRDAAAWVRRARSSDYRLRIDHVGNQPVRWTLEHVAAEGCVHETLASGHPAMFAGFRGRRSEYRQNGQDKAAAPAAVE